MLEDSSLPALFFSLQVGYRHVADGTLILDVRLRLRMVHQFAPYATLPIRISRRVCHDAGTPVETDGDILAGLGLQTIVTGKATVGSVKLSLGLFARRFPAQQGR